MRFSKLNSVKPISLKQLNRLGVDFSPAELITLVRARLFPDPITFVPLQWDEVEVVAHIYGSAEVELGFMCDPDWAAK